MRNFVKTSKPVRFINEEAMDRKAEREESRKSKRQARRNTIESKRTWEE